MGDIIILVMVASLCQVSGNEQLKSFIVTVTVPHSPLEAQYADRQRSCGSNQCPNSNSLLEI